MPLLLLLQYHLLAYFPAEVFLGLPLSVPVIDALVLLFTLHLRDSLTQTGDLLRHYAELLRDTFLAVLTVSVLTVGTRRFLHTEFVTRNVPQVGLDRAPCHRRS